jgi:hypothetical protein
LAKTTSECEKIVDIKKRRECIESLRTPVQTQSKDEEMAGTLDFIGNISKSAGSSDDGALIVFAVIGIVVLIVWIPYTARYIYKWAKDSEAPGWWQLDMATTLLDNKEISPGVKRDGYSFGPRLSLFMGAESEHQMALIAEVGKHHLVTEQLGVKQKSDGIYAMAGPGIFWGFRQFQAGLQILGGTSDDNDTGLISKASGRMQFSFLNISASLEFGTYYSQINDWRGISRDIDGFQYFAGFGLGYLF